MFRGAQNAGENLPQNVAQGVIDTAADGKKTKPQARPWLGAFFLNKARYIRLGYLGLSRVKSTFVPIGSASEGFVDQIDRPAFAARPAVACPKCQTPASFMTSILDVERKKPISVYRCDTCRAVVWDRLQDEVRG